MNSTLIFPCFHTFVWVSKQYSFALKKCIIKNAQPNETQTKLDSDLSGYVIRPNVVWRGFHIEYDEIEWQTQLAIYHLKIVSLKRIARELEHACTAGALITFYVFVIFFIFIFIRYLFCNFDVMVSFKDSILFKTRFEKGLEKTIHSENGFNYLFIGQKTNTTQSNRKQSIEANVKKIRCENPFSKLNVQSAFAKCHLLVR